VGDGEAGPVEDPLRQPVVVHGVALGVLAGADLRHVHDAVDAGLLRGLGEVGRRLDDPGADGVAEIRTLDPLHRCTNGARVEEIAEHDLSPQFLESLRPGVLPVGQRSHVAPARQELLDRCPRRCSRSRRSPGLCPESFEFSLRVG